MTRPILKQYSLTAREQTTPPSARACRARYVARFIISELPSLTVPLTPLLLLEGSGVSVRDGAEVILGITASEGGDGVEDGLGRGDCFDLPFFG